MRNFKKSGINTLQEWLVYNILPMKCLCELSQESNRYLLDKGMFRNRCNVSNGQHWVIVTARQRVLRVIHPLRSDSNCSKDISNCKPSCCVKYDVHRSFNHYSDVTMCRMASQITSLMIAYSTVYPGSDQRKHQSSAPLAFCAGNLPVTGEFPAQMASYAENVSI